MGYEIYNASASDGRDFCLTSEFRERVKAKAEGPSFNHSSGYGQIDSWVLLEGVGVHVNPDNSLDLTFCLPKEGERAIARIRRELGDITLTFLPPTETLRSATKPVGSNVLPEAI